MKISEAIEALSKARDELGKDLEVAFYDPQYDAVFGMSEVKTLPDIPYVLVEFDQTLHFEGLPLEELSGGSHSEFPEGSGG